MTTFSASRSDIQGTNGTQRNHGYAVQDNRIAADPNAPHYAVQQHRSSSRLSLKSQPPHYATMTGILHDSSVTD